MTFNLDGEPLSGKTFRMELLPAALRCRLLPTARCYAKSDRGKLPGDAALAGPTVRTFYVARISAAPAGESM